MPRFLVPVLAITLVACPSPTPQVDPVTPAVESPVPTPQPTPPPTPFVCTGWEDQLRANDFASANTIFANCLTQDEDNAIARMGRALTGMVLLYDSEPVREMLTTCDESPELYGPLLGPNGVLAANTAAVQGTATLTAERIIDGVVTPSSFLDSVEYAWTEDSGRDLTIADSFLQYERLRLDLYSADTLGVGDVISITPDENYVSVSVPCDLDPTACDNDYPSQASGTVTVVEVPAQNGNLVVDIDVNAPMPCDACTSSTMHVTGRITDTITDLEPVARTIPFVEALEDGRCNTQDHCDYRTGFITALADVCPAGTADLGIANASLIRALFESFADDFEAVAADPSFTMTYPMGGFFFIQSDVAFNQTDALLLAGIARGMAGSIALGTSYDLIDADATFGSRGVVYTAADTQGESCGTDEYWGVSVAAMATELDTHLGTIRSDADFVGARAQLLGAFVDFSAAATATPEASGMVDFSQSAAWSALLASDLEVVVASLQGTDGTLATSDAYTVSLEAFFADPTDRADAIAELAVPELFFTQLDDEACEDEFAYAATENWWIQDAGLFHVSDAALHDHGTAPSWVEDFEGVLDSDDIPLWASDSVRALEADYSYVP